MSNKTEKHNVLTDSEKVEFLNLLKNKGERPAENWVLVHSELCEENELDIPLEELLSKFNSQKFAVDVVSNPNEESFLDSGNVKVRYRYVLSPEHAGESEIKDNTREFCETLIRKDLIYRREDINIMSFRGANPISTQNYSIFRLQGYWNCRHAWQREIYITQTAKGKTENGNLINKDIAMSKETFKNKFGNWLKGLGVKLTEEEIVEANKVMLGAKAEGLKFVDVDVDGKMLRIDAEKIEEGAAVSWVDAEGNLTDVENGDLTVLIDDKPMIITIEDRVIKTIKDVQAAEGDKGAEAQMSAEEGNALKQQVADLETKLPTMIAEAISTAMSESKAANEKAITEAVSEKLKDIPAFMSDKINGNTSGGSSDEKEGTMLERMTIKKN